ncbi:DUF6624 domain-containing protein [Mucilaginibacter auburnensis]|uniref:Uncharacterized protein n=1 Tax=Mucilaginibacter auburnensis TaxID=1457233 RepID=A0A2H9VPE6_9SPHI|nr:DUF6624 domain-containing protein [Mucilaginibacter auburnensis]PJJ80181.1 hypothetical protein CLV57_3328 [Mucilaginibacter auburnensis]
MKRFLFTLLLLFILTAIGYAQTPPNNNVHSNTNVTERLKAVLDSVYNVDQEIRERINSAGEKYGLQSKERNDLFAVMAKSDSSNLIIVLDILRKYGWLGTDKVGEKGNKAIWLVVQHSDLKTQKKYLPFLKKSVEKGLSKPYYLALTLDRIAMGEGKKQIYGSQFTRDMTTGKYVVYPIKDEAHLDERRKAMGMEPMVEYAKSMDAEYTYPR